jgi:hypothetical protein
MSNKISTNMAKTVLFRKLVNDRKFDLQCPLVAEEHIEHELIQIMTEIDPNKRPSAYDIQKHIIPEWQQ